MYDWTRTQESIVKAAESVLSLRESDDWQCAFREAQGRCAAVHGYRGSLAAFSVDDVVRVIARSDGENDGPEWIGAFELSDGRFVFVAAHCDYTGWDCKAGGYVRVAASLTDLVRWGIGQNERARLGDQLPAVDPS